MFIDIKKDNIVMQSIQKTLNDNYLLDKGVNIPIPNTSFQVTLKKVPALPQQMSRVYQGYQGMGN